MLTAHQETIEDFETELIIDGWEKDPEQNINPKIHWWRLRVIEGRKYDFTPFWCVDTVFKTASLFRWRVQFNAVEPVNGTRLHFN